MAGLSIGMAAQLWQRTDSALLEGDTPWYGEVVGRGSDIQPDSRGVWGEGRFLWKWSRQKGCIQNREAHKTYEAVMVQLPQLILGE